MASESLPYAEVRAAVVKGIPPMPIPTSELVHELVLLIVQWHTYEWSKERDMPCPDNEAENAAMVAEVMERRDPGAHHGAIGELVRDVVRRTYPW